MSQCLLLANNDNANAHLQAASHATMTTMITMRMVIVMMMIVARNGVDSQLARDAQGSSHAQCQGPSAVAALQLPCPYSASNCCWRNIVQDED